MYIRQDDKHINGQGWTTIDANKCKPNSKTSNKITIDSIVSTIDIEFNIDTNGTLEATINSPIRENRCVVPDTNVYNKKNTQGAKEHEQGKATKSAEEEGRKERTSRKTTTETNKNTERKEEEKHEKQYDLERQNKTTMSSKKNDTKTEEIKERIGTKSAEQENKEFGITKIVTGEFHANLAPL